eukprot:5861695-Pyramimonas_sp.AAC.1
MWGKTLHPQLPRPPTNGAPNRPPRERQLWALRTSPPAPPPLRALIAHVADLAADEDRAGPLLPDGQ